MFAQLGLKGNTTSLLATGVYGIVNTLSTLPALFLIDKVGRRPLLLCGATGTFISLVIVGGIIGGYGERLVNDLDLTLTGPGGDGFLSVVTPLSPVGKAVLGRRTGETVDVTVEREVREWTITWVG